jgi:ubiquitin carboxyl-terminal hydrolase 14
MVRFYWRRDISKKTKIMRKVKFPFDLDVLDIVTDDLKAKIRPVNERFKDIDKDRRERAKVRRRAKVITDQQAPTPAPPAETVASANPSDDPPEEMAVDTPAAEVPDAVRKAGELVDEPTKRREEVEALNALIDADLKSDRGANVTGLYELAGIVTHKGASADGDK